MSELRTEEEQIAAIKNWWKENGNSVLLAVGSALAIVFGWKAWQNNVEQTKAEASAMYQQILIGEAGQSDDNTNTTYVADKLKEDYSGTEYALYAALFLAKEAVEAEDYDKALSELDYVLENTEDVRTTHIVLARKARVLSQTGEHDAALELLSATDQAFAPKFLEITGDIKLRQGDKQAAMDAYKSAYALVKDAPQKAPLLAVKLSNLGIDAANL